MRRLIILFLFLSGCAQAPAGGGYIAPAQCPSGNWKCKSGEIEGYPGLCQWCDYKAPAGVGGEA